MYELWEPTRMNRWSAEYTVVFKCPKPIMWDVTAAVYEIHDTQNLVATPGPWLTVDA